MRMYRFKYNWPFVLILITILGLVYMNAAIINRGAAGNSNFAGIINVAGKQRMLSQRLLTHYALQQANQAGYADFTVLLRVWSNNHYKLVDDITFYNNYSALTNLITRLEPLYNKLYKGYTDTGAVVWQRRLPELVQWQSAYLSTMDSVVNTLEKTAQASFMQMRNRQIVVAAVSGFVLLLEILLFLIPHFRKLLRAYALQRKQQHDIGSKQLEISRQNQNLHQQNVELIQLKEQLSLTLSGINAGVWSWNIVTGEQEWSPKFYQLLGYQPGEVAATPHTFFNLLFVGVQQEVRTAVQEHLEKGTPYKLNIRMRRKNGTLDWFELSGEAARDREGKPIAMAGSIIYTGEKMAYLQQLEDARKQYSEKLVTLGHLVTVAVKELTAALYKRSRNQTGEDPLPAVQEDVRKSLEELERKVEELLR